VPSATTVELVPPNKLIPIIMKHSSPTLLANGLVKEFVDKDTWFKSYVNGSSDKTELDPKCKIFSVHKFIALKDTDYPKAWHRCVKAIDGKARNLKRRMN